MMWWYLKHCDHLIIKKKIKCKKIVQISEKLSKPS